MDESCVCRVALRTHDNSCNPIASMWCEESAAVLRGMLVVRPREQADRQKNSLETTPTLNVASDSQHGTVCSLSETDATCVGCESLKRRLRSDGTQHTTHLFADQWNAVLWEVSKPMMPTRLPAATDFAETDSGPMKLKANVLSAVFLTKVLRLKIDFFMTKWERLKNRQSIYLYLVGHFVLLPGNFERLFF